METEALFWTWLPYLFFGTLALATLNLPPLYSFDEVYYVEAAKEYLLFNFSRNWEHPPLAKYIMGWSWYLFHEQLGFLGELASFRICSVLFGMIALAGFERWTRILFEDSLTRIACLWSVGFNFMWFVQSKTAMLDVYFLAFGIWGTYFVNSNSSTRRYTGWCFLGLAVGCKWAALSYILIAIAISFKRGIHEILKGLSLAILIYAALYIPHAFLIANPLSVVLFPKAFLLEQLRMLRGLQSISNRTHGYQSTWWQWVTLSRPMWYAFSKSIDPVTQQLRIHSAFMGGNPAIFAAGTAGIIYTLFSRLRNDPRVKLMCLFFVVPLIIWILTPRKLMFFYYIIPSALWYGPFAFLALSEMTQNSYGRWIKSIVLVEGALFLAMLPFLDGRSVSFEFYAKYFAWWMKYFNWI